ncbi:phage tail assembly chaperone [Pseudomonas frederiksbergensis]|nr:phage tail assembly chaperone [Pseudomonas frederiksbergensis]
MAVYARVEDGVVVELVDTGDYEINQLFAPDFLTSMVCVPEGVDVKPGTSISYIGQTFELPVVLGASGTTDTSNTKSEDPLAQERIWRQSILVASQWLTTRHRDEQELGRVTTLTVKQHLELLEYRQALRDWPTAESFPAIAARPEVPGCLAGVLSEASSFS